MNVSVSLGDRSYDVCVREGARRDLPMVLSELAPHAHSAVVVTSAALSVQPWFDVDTGLFQTTLLVPDGEAAKNLDALEDLLEAMAGAHLSRADVVVGVGGGAVTDLAGFAAAIYLRGISLVQVPTSLVGQVDAAIGGKTGVNLRAGKNLVGSFHQPLAVLCDTEVLATLPVRERGSGLGEVAKCWILEGRGADALAHASLSELIEVSVALKARVVSEDEREGASRVVLNYGHTLGHALEKLAWRSGPDELRHGEAVAIGLAFAARLARALGRVDNEVVDYHDAVLATLHLERRLGPTYDTAELIEAMGFDKKAHHDLSFVLAGPEGFELVRGLDPAFVARVVDQFKGES